MKMASSFQRVFMPNDCTYFPVSRRETWWSIVKSSLGELISTLRTRPPYSPASKESSLFAFKAVTKAIHSYKSLIPGELDLYNFEILYFACEEYETRVNRLDLATVLISIAQACLELDNLFPLSGRAGDPLQLLMTLKAPYASAINSHGHGNQHHDSQTIQSRTLTKRQIHCLLANAFMCTFPKRESHNIEFQNFPRINFTRLFHKDFNESPDLTLCKKEKLLCLFNYFTNLAEMKSSFSPELDYNIHFERKLQRNAIDWQNCDKPLSQVELNMRRKIEEAKGSLQVDFANKFIGGGTLGNGAVQEEIRFVICPELILSQLITEKLGDKEVLLVRGVRQYSDYLGYSTAFRYLGNCAHSIQSDVVAMDALYFRRGSEWTQFQKENIDRELMKCFCAFYNTKPDQDRSPIATGKWGCGIFNGDVTLKLLIQLMAASVADRPLQLFLVGDQKTLGNMKELTEYFFRNQFTVSKLYKTILAYETEQMASRISLEDFILNRSSFLGNIYRSVINTGGYFKTMVGNRQATCKLALCIGTFIIFWLRLWFVVIRWLFNFMWRLIKNLNRCFFPNSTQHFFKSVDSPPNATSTLTNVIAENPVE